MSVGIEPITPLGDGHEEHAPRTVRDLLQQLEMRLHRGLLQSAASNPKTEFLSAADEAATVQYEAREIVAHVLRLTPGQVQSRIDFEVSAERAAHAFAIASRRTTGEPLAYCLGSAAFRHLELLVDPRVLIPRPETEVVVEEALRVASTNPGGIAVDIGTGSGAIALSLATEGRFDRVIATDLSPDALAVARINAEHVLAASGNAIAPVEFRQGADFEPLAGIKAHLVVSNPPYIAEEESGELPASVRDWEPSMALFAADGGMARYDALLAGAPAHLVPGGWLVLEVDSRRAVETQRRAELTGYFSSVQLKRDLTGRDRVLLARLHGDISGD